MLLNDVQITERCRLPAAPMIDPFLPTQVKRDGNSQKLVSFGLSSFGYDIRVADEFMIFTNLNQSIVDPKAVDENAFVKRTTREPVILPPNSFMLCRTMEWLNMPDDVMAICIGKSTYARCGLIVNVTPIEPGWKGQITIEVSNTTPLPARVYPMEGIAQLVFLKGDRPHVTYADRQGKYMNQLGVTLPRV